ncbi:PAQR family membrane homeostasis protein TrhA [Pedobacter antarcticus]|uniref:PAQR family membrane homeostasis protein TrhA n=1 Tax=Pedobacter antarcticus TaxID=34086 RepID=UPI002931E10D|nr:hemolysin III family protein [Pedobacter antarcticus]
MENQYSRKQELIHGLIHGVGVLFGVSGLPVLTALATSHQNTPGIIGAGIYGFCFLLLFTSSMVYHLLEDVQVKKLFEIFDHISIYFLIAGTYTPFLLVYVNNSFGISLLASLWALTLLGIFFKIWFTGRFGAISTLIYLLMGWALIVGGKRFFSDLPVSAIIMILIGAGLYSVGVAFYAWGKRRYTHALWHGIVLAAAVCHYVAVLLVM